MTELDQDLPEFQLPALAFDPAVTIHYDLEMLGALGQCGECLRHPPPGYLTGSTPLAAGAWRISYTSDDQDLYVDTCGRWCSDWVLAALLSDLAQPVRNLVLHAPTSWAPPGPRRAVRGPSCTPTQRTL